jgi:hypothetical protein
LCGTIARVHVNVTSQNIVHINDIFGIINNANAYVGNNQIALTSNRGVTRNVNVIVTLLLLNRAVEIHSILMKQFVGALVDRQLTALIHLNLTKKPVNVSVQTK